ncbi:hypothetical protein AUC71_04315 [Methyloceanibacter marginalis]|uniref:Glycosyl transferase 64 domain-containing protein n=1 Tax=Methyloceanibacter marginalis TaxID=1774971 RepID=A0A1E3VTF3_9HYPH|nr:hypothetical protein [Methyloceanibacter marginalis]ODR96797.1 hypothetical protein AUC71_04315 [Methyloceanibacter marginalis]
MSLILGSVLQRLKKAGFPKAEVPLIERVRQSQRDFYSKIEFKLLFDRGKQRRFLVFIQCSANSYNKALLSNRNRSFDLLLNFYDGVPDLRPEVEIACHQIGSKCTAISKITCESPDLLDRYEWVLFLDDDIELSTDQLNALFAEVDNSSLDAAQPALSHDSPGAGTPFERPAWKVVQRSPTRSRS